jgi:radical SAM superfamily enzyme YgiQ (UPF0313 family)
MKVALLTAKPDPKMNFNVSEKKPSNGLGYLFVILKKHNHEVNIYDRYCGQTEWPEDNFASYDFLGLYCTSICKKDITYILSNVKAKIIAVGGPHATLFPNWFPSNVNYIVCGEGENIINDLVTQQSDTKGVIIYTKRLSNNELDSLPRYPYAFFWDKQRKQYYTWKFPFSNNQPIFSMNSSRGCPFNCTFCDVKHIWSRQYTMMSAERIIDDINYIKAGLNGVGIYFREDNFTISKQRTTDFCNLLLKKNLKIQYACETRVDTIDFELMKLMHKSGCIGFYVGIEALNDHMLKIYNKEITVGQIVKFFENANSFGIKIAASMITNHPEETSEDRLRNQIMLQKLNPAIIWNNKFRQGWDKPEEY